MTEMTLGHLGGLESSFQRIFLISLCSYHSFVPTQVRDRRTDIRTILADIMPTLYALRIAVGLKMYNGQKNECLLITNIVTIFRLSSML